MNQLIMILIVIVTMIISWVCGDFCDICVCMKRSEQEHFELINIEQIEEFYYCNASEQSIKETHSPLDLNSIQWPRKNGSVLAQFINFKMTYLTA